MGEFPSGQRGQTVNLLLIASVVRIHLPPPIPNTKVLGIFAFLRIVAGFCYQKVLNKECHFQLTLILTLIRLFFVGQKCSFIDQ